MCPHFSSLKTSCSSTLVKPKFSLGNPMGLIYWVSSDHARTGTSNVCNLIVVSVHNSTSACLSTAYGWALNWFWCPRVRTKALPRSMSRMRKLTYLGRVRNLKSKYSSWSISRRECGKGVKHMETVVWEKYLTQCESVVYFEFYLGTLMPQLGFIRPPKDRAR